MEYEWDDAKNEANIEKHRIGFEALHGFEWGTAIVNATRRHGEARYIATSYIGPRLHTVIYTERGDRTRIISLRRASTKEEIEYAQA